MNFRNENVNNFEISLNLEKNKLDNNILSLFLHSFSLVKWRKNPDSPVIWKKNIRKYRKSLLEVKNSSNIQIVSEGEIDKLFSNNTNMITIEGNDSPQIKVKNWFKAYYFLLATSFRIAEHNKKARFFIFVNVCLVAIVLATIINSLLRFH